MQDGSRRLRPSSADTAGLVSLRLSKAGKAIDGAQVSLTADHPVGLVASRTIVLRSLGDGAYRADERLPRGRWLIRIGVRTGAETAAFDDEIRI